MAKYTPLLATSTALGGLLGVCFHASQLYTPKPPMSGGGSALNVLLATLTLFFSLEVLWSHIGTPLSTGPYATRCRQGIQYLLFLVIPLLAVLLVVGFRLDSAAWCIPLFIGHLLSHRSLGPHASFSFFSSSPSSRAVAEEKLSQDHHEAHLLPEGSGTGGINNGEAEGVGSSSSSSTPALLPTFAASCSACCCPPRGTPLHHRLGFYAHSLVWGAAVITLTFLLGGAGTIAAGWQRYHRRGVQYDLRPAGVPALIHAWCSGPSYSPSRPTIWLDCGGGGHSSSDVYGLQLALNAGGHRVCVYDPPGTGWSPLLQAADTIGATAPAQLLALSQAMGERGPFILVGTMDGGAERIYAFALAHPALVRALVPMQYGVAEFTGWAQYQGLAVGDPAVLAYAQAQIQARVGMCDLIRTLGTGWGLVPLFAPSSPRFVPPSAQQECHFLNLFHEGQWDMQCRLLAAQVRNPATIMAPSLWQSNRTLGASIPVLALGNFPPGDVCAFNRVDPGGQDCAVLKITTAVNQEFMVNMTTMTGGSLYVNGCGPGGLDSVCLDWMGGGATVPFVAKQIGDFVGNLTRGGG